MQNSVTVIGTDKITGEEISIALDKEGFEEWLSGIPLKYAIPNLTIEIQRFLQTGTKSLQE